MSHQKIPRPQAAATPPLPAKRGEGEPGIGEASLRPGERAGQGRPAPDLRAEQDSEATQGAAGAASGGAREESAREPGGLCPYCDKAIPASADPAWRPFCSKRCKLADLGQWFSGAYAIPAEPETGAGAGDAQPSVKPQ